MMRRARTSIWASVSALALLAFAASAPDPAAAGYLYDGSGGYDAPWYETPYAPAYPYSPPGYAPPPYPYYYPWSYQRGIYGGPPESERGARDVIPAGRLVLLVEPVSAEVLVDGYPLKQRNDLSYQIGLLVGKHAVEVRAEGYQPYRREVNVEPGRQMMLTVRLNRY
jgi:hypothetical protein